MMKIIRLIKTFLLYSLTRLKFEEYADRSKFEPYLVGVDGTVFALGYGLIDPQGPTADELQTEYEQAFRQLPDEYLASITHVELIMGVDFAARLLTSQSIRRRLVPFRLTESQLITELWVQRFLFPKLKLVIVPRYPLSYAFKFSGSASGVPFIVPGAQAQRKTEKV
jgi:hypothetical protein